MTHGLSYSDEGTALTLYQNIWAHPASIADTFGTWLTSAVAPSLGVWGYRILAMACIILTLSVSYRLLCCDLTAHDLRWGLGLGAVASLPIFTPPFFHYGGFSQCLLVAATYLLVSGLTSHIPWRVTCAGFLLGVSVFARLPNILMFAVLGMIWLRPSKCRGLELANALLGATVGSLVVILWMREVGQWPLYLQSLSYLAEPAQGHGPYSRLVWDVVSGWGRLVWDGLVVSFVVAAWLWWSRGWTRLAWMSTLGVGLAGLAVFYSTVGIPVIGRTYSFLYLLSVGAALWMAGWSAKPVVGLTAYAVLVQLVMWPIGSGAGFVNLTYVLPLAMPLVVEWFDWPTLPNWWPRLGYAIAGMFLVAYGVSVYQAPEPRWQHTATVNHPALAHIQLTPAKAANLEGVLKAVQPYVREGEPLFVAWQAPIINYLTKTTPYFPHPWSEIYPRSKIERLLEERACHGNLPPIVQYGVMQYDNILQAFITKYQYVRRYTNSEFTVWVR